MDISKLKRLNETINDVVNNKPKDKQQLNELFGLKDIFGIQKRRAKEEAAAKVKWDNIDSAHKEGKARLNKTPYGNIFDLLRKNLWIVGGTDPQVTWNDMSILTTSMASIENGEDYDEKKLHTAISNLTKTIDRLMQDRKSDNKEFDLNASKIQQLMKST
jgi:DNA-binding ferritin-like protein (Dps family)